MRYLNIPHGWGPKKYISKNLIKDHLTSRGMAYWFMDDGGKLDYTKNEGKGIVFNTQSFTQEEVNNMCKELKEKFNLHTWVGKNKNRHIIKISGHDYEKMMDLIDPYIIAAMKYKLPTPRK